jgi:NADPH-dependent F420 reductase
MKVAVIGTGNMGSGIAKLLTPKHDVVVGSRDPDKAAKVASDLGADRGASYGESAQDAEVIFLAIPWTAVDETLPQLGNVTGKVIVDLTNPYVDGKLQLHDGTSDAEIIQSKAPDARVVKGWNTIFGQVLANGPDFGGVPASVFLAGDDEQAKSAVSELARDMGFEPIDCGELEKARRLERLLAILGTFANGFEWGNWALAVLHR